MRYLFLRVLLAVILLYGADLSAQALPGDEVCGNDQLAQRYRGLDVQAGARRKTALGLPPPIPGSPEYLVRVVYLMPTDRQPADPAAYNAQVEAATLRIRASLEMMGDYFAAQITGSGADGPGLRPNFERNSQGRIEVMALRGTQTTLEYWGDSSGLDYNHVSWGALVDIFGSATATEDACAKTIHVVFVDSLTLDASGPTFQWRGYVGGGSGLRGGDKGYGGYLVMSYGVLEFLPKPLSDDRPGREAAFRSALCDESLELQVGNYTGHIPGIPPPCGSISRDLNRTELLSVFQGVLAHEFSHTCGLGHDGIAGELMGSGYVRYGQSIRTLLGVECDRIALTAPGCSSGGTGPAFAHRLSHSPYLSPITNPDKTNPAADLAWPPAGYFYAEPEVPNQTKLRVAASDVGGSGLSSAMGYEDGWSRDYELFNPGAPTLEFSSRFVGRREFYVQVIDGAGNQGAFPHPVFGRVDAEGAQRYFWTSYIWVRRPPTEDTRPRDLSMPLGSFMNPYADIQTAIDAANQYGGLSGVFIGLGTWPVAVPLRPQESVGISGEGVGRTILDGSGGLSAIFQADNAGGKMQKGILANLTMRNAVAGISAPLPRDQIFHYAILNCLFMDLAGYAVDLNRLGGSFDVSQNTVYHCGGGIRLKSYDPFIVSDRFTFRNNLVANCTGVGIEMIDIAGMDTNPRVGGNLSFGNGTNWSGDGQGTAGLSYATHRWPGEISLNPAFAASSPVEPVDLQLTAVSGALHKGLAPTENQNGTPRNIGAWLNDFPISLGNVWMLR